ncbi:MAG: L-rhamnose mutarotase [Niabella sp.]|nr:L-rhamnose mutarotase [Niabella sp.]
MKRLNSVLLLVISLLAACTQPTTKQKDTNSTTGSKVERYGMVTGLKPERAAYYKQLHAAVWPAVLKKIRECNIRNYSIYVKEIDGKPYLFSYWEYTGNDFAADMRKMAADSTTQRWWKETGPTQEPLPDAAAKGETWSRMEELFHQD